MLTRAVARTARKTLIRSGVDRRLADATYRQPRQLLTRLFRPDCEDYRGTPRRRAARNGIMFDLELWDFVQWTIYFGTEIAEKSALFDLAKPGQVVLDIGTNVGEVLMNFAKRVGPEGRVIGFEPNPETLAKCRHNLSLNSFSNVEVHGVALGDTRGTALLGQPAKFNTGADRIGAAGVPVQLTTLDEFAADLDRIDLIKIDVEGFDLKVVRGGEQMLKRHRPTLFVELCDSNLREQGDSPAELVHWLETRGFRIRNAVTGEPIASTDDLNGCFRDIIAAPLGR
jgi:FkbM family methyltransferase